MPLILWGGPFQGGKVIDQPVSLGDLYPTIVDLVGQPATHALAGTSLVGVAAGEQREFVASYTSGDRKAVISKEWHFIQHGDGGVELYRRNRTEDPWALNNVAG